MKNSLDILTFATLTGGFDQDGIHNSARLSG
jgi:hypothetical protein